MSCEMAEAASFIHTQGHLMSGIITFTPHLESVPLGNRVSLTTGCKFVESVPGSVGGRRRATQAGRQAGWPGPWVAA